MNSCSAIGIMDYGIGGLGLFKSLRDSCFSRDIVYFSDSGTTPYGKLDRYALTSRVSEILDFIRGLGISQVVIACNAAGTIVKDIDTRGIELLNVIDSAVKTVHDIKPVSLAVFGGERTIRSDLYGRIFRAQGIKVVQRVTQPLSIHIEKGDTGSDILCNLVTRYCKSIRSCDALLLACTHYPAIMELFSQNLKDNVAVLDPVKTLSGIIIGNWNHMSRLKGDTFYTTGDKTSMKNAARIAFSVNVGDRIFSV